MTGFEQSALLRSFKGGEEVAFETVFKTYYKPLRVQAFLLLHNKEDAEDQVQQLFLDIWNRQLYRNIKESLKSYLYTAVRNRCFNFLQQSSRLQQYKEKFAGQEAIVATQATEEPFLDGRYRVALERLPVQRSRAFQLVYMEDKKYLQAAEEMGISINSLKSHLRLAVKFLRVQLQK